MEFKDLASNGLALLALAFSIYATFKAEKNSREERKRTIRGQLTDVLGKLTSLNIDGAKLAHEARGDKNYAEFIGSALSQQNGFLLDQADFLSEQIPALVTTYEFNTIALACVNAGDTMRAEKYHRRAIAVAPPGLYKSQATRSYALFLFGQGRPKEGRQHFRSGVLARCDALAVRRAARRHRRMALHAGGTGAGGATRAVPIRRRRGVRFPQRSGP